MFTFAYPKLLFLLLLVPMFVFLFVWARWMRRRNLAKFGKVQNLSELMPLVSPYKPPIKISLRMGALTMIILALCRPWGGLSNKNTTREGIEVMIAVDASNSMLASSTDDPKSIDRMHMAKLSLEKLIDNLGNDRVGLIVYAGEAYTLIPVTNDFTSAKMFLNSIEPSQMPSQGTNIGAAIDMATASFSKTKDIGKAIVLLTDAEELEDPASVDQAVKKASKAGIQVDVIGVGATKPMQVPTPEGPLINPETGQPVETALNEDLAIRIAKDGKGIYVNAANKDAVTELDKKLNQLQKKSLESSFLAIHDELFTIFLWIGIALMIIDIFVLDRKITWLDRFSFFKKESASSGKSGLGMLVLLLLGASALSSCSSKDKKDATEGESKDAKTENVEKVYSTQKEFDLINEGNALYSKSRFDQAMAKYDAAFKDNSRSDVAPFNLALADASVVVARLAAADSLQRAGQLAQAQQGQQAQQAQQGDSIANQLMQQASELFQSVARRNSPRRNISSMAWYNMGNISFLGKDFSNAIAQYKEALRLNPADNNARRNLRIAQLQQQQNDKDKNKNQNQDQNQDQDQNKNKNQDQNQNQPPKQQPQQPKLDNQTSDQILNAIERKENQTRMQRHARPEQAMPRSGRNW